MKLSAPRSLMSWQMLRFTSVLCALVTLLNTAVQASSAWRDWEATTCVVSVEHKDGLLTGEAAVNHMQRSACAHAIMAAVMCAVSFVCIAVFCRAHQHVTWGKAGLCVNCGYNLTGNVTGICPECGEAT